VKLLYGLNDRHFEDIRHQWSPATREVLLKTNVELRSIQNGCISFCPRWLVLNAR
jgi:hypothetical protein